jgi:hypothetical protein
MFLAMSYGKRCALRLPESTMEQGLIRQAVAQKPVKHTFHGDANTFTTWQHFRVKVILGPESSSTNSMKGYNMKKDWLVYGLSAILICKNSSTTQQDTLSSLRLPKAAGL